MNQEDILALITNEVAESRGLDYKLDLWSGQSATREFLCDITAMANTDGGLILIGIEEERDEQGKRTGKPSNVRGISVANFEQWKQQHLSLLRTNCDPPLGIGVEVDLYNVDGKSVVGIHVKRSWLCPHRVRIDKQSYFYMRTSVGNEPMDSREIRRAFLDSEQETDKLRRFIEDRISSIYAGQTPIQMDARTYFVIHIIPRGNSFSEASHDLSSLLGKDQVGWTFNGHPAACLPTFEGRLGLYGRTDGGTHQHYVLVFRNAVFEVVHSFEPRESMLQGYYWEDGTAKCIFQNLSTLAKAGLPPDFLVFLTLVNVRGLMFAEGREYVSGQTLRWDVLPLPAVEISEFPENAEAARKMLQPAIDIAWQATGRSKSPHG